MLCTYNHLYEKVHTKQIFWDIFFFRYFLLSSVPLFLELESAIDLKYSRKIDNKEQVSNAFAFSTNNLQVTFYWNLFL